MEIFHHFNGLPPAFRGSAVAIGNFDGMHLGHRALIGEAGRIARGQGLPWAVLTFEPHPRSLFQPDAAPFRLTSFRAKARAIEALGVDVLVCLAFDRDFSRQSADAFVSDVLAGGLGARHVVCGYDFVFGHNRGGNAELLMRAGERLGFAFTSVAAVGDRQCAVYSATRARNCLTDGKPAEAAAVLGRPFEIEGPVERGDARGRTIGFPTANVALGEYLRPKIGVYAVRVMLEGERRWRDGACNLGFRPTVDGKGHARLEVFVFDFDGDLYGRYLRVAFIDFIRPEMQFTGIDQLKTQIESDCREARARLARAPAMPEGTGNAGTHP
jgi:riboflavin kinase/FMN adenylyltransferase